MMNVLSMLPQEMKLTNFVLELIFDSSTLTILVTCSSIAYLEALLASLGFFLLSSLICSVKESGNPIT